jgi:sterol 3beta-glucosyltransferase
MILPIRDVLSAQKCRPFQFNCHGLLLVIKGHEELFFEFKTAARREHFMEILEKQVDMTRTKTQDVPNLKEGARDALILEELEYSELPIEDPQPPPDTGIESLPAVMFASTSSTFLTFKPPEPLHFTFLSIGSRGDVQPYIALGKGLMADGHRVKIATHEEYKDWILSVMII